MAIPASPVKPVKRQHDYFICMSDVQAQIGKAHESNLVMRTSFFNNTATNIKER
jgi:hypothetical protein